MKDECSASIPAFLLIGSAFFAKPPRQVMLFLCVISFNVHKKL